MNPLISQFGSDARWVNWRLQTLKGKKTKIPYDINGKKASSTDPSAWSTYADTKAANENVGIVFKPDQLLLGIDVDHIVEKDGKLPKNIQKFVKEANTYTELSPSHTGLHLFIALTEPLKLEAHKHAPFELYTSGRYFTVTENIYGESKNVRTMTPADVLTLLESIGYPWKESEISPQSPVFSPSLATLDDSILLDKMFAAKNGSDIKKLWDNTSGITDESSADMALMSHLAFWTGRNHTQMERLWLSSPLGAREKTKKRKDYRDRTINKAIKDTKEIYETPSMKVQKKSEEYDLDLLYTINSRKDRVYTQNTENICRILRNHPNFTGRFRYDFFRNVLEIFDKGKWRNLEDNDAVDIQAEISILFSYFGKVGKEMVYDAIIRVSRENTIDSALDYVKALVWDKAPRLDQWLVHTYGTPDDIYHRSVGSNWLKGMVKRIVEPGCKFDHVLVLEGPQGSKKSTSLNILGGNWYIETTISTDTKDFFMQLVGNLVIEFSEGETLSRSEVKKMKAIITTQNDKFRPAYGRSFIDFPRRCVFAMTTNDEEYLKDETGNRRWLPVKLLLPEADIEWLKQNRDQLFAEAYYRVVNLKETVYEFPQEEVMAAQKERRIHYEHEDVIVTWYHELLTDDQREQGITVNQVYRDAMNGSFPSKLMGKYDEMKIADVLRNILDLQNKQIMIRGIRTRRWFTKEQIKIMNDGVGGIVFKSTEEF